MNRLLSTAIPARDTEDPYFRLLFSNVCAVDRNPARNRLRVANGITNPSEPGTPPVVTLSDSTVRVRTNIRSDSYFVVKYENYISSALEFQVKTLK